MVYLILFLVWLFISWSVAHFFLNGHDHSKYDTDLNEFEIFDAHSADADANQRFLKKIKSIKHDAISTKSLKKAASMARKFADNLSADLKSDCQFIPIDIDGTKAEWTIAPGADINRRVLLHHGGAFVLGSPKGHRILAHELSHRAKAAVLSVDYRMLPESSRTAGIKDAQKCYRWILNNAPTTNSSSDTSESATAEFLLLAGDSAGGNLTMMLSSWSKIAGLRRPDGVVAFSPSLDMTCSSPTMKTNRSTDPILGQVLGAIVSIPTFLRAWLALLLMRANPASKASSPLFYELADLPPTLIQASSSEMLLGESIRYTNKARAAGSKVSLQIWRDQVHDWQLFNHTLGSAKQAWQEVSKFIESLSEKASNKQAS